MKRNRYGLIAFILCAVFLLPAGDTASAVNYDRKIKEAEQEQKEYEKKSEKLQEELADIEKDKQDTLLYIEKLDKKTEEVEQQLAGLSQQIVLAQSRLDESEKELAAAQAEEETQYMRMKQRIKYMYENGNQDYLEILFSADGMADLLNRTEYIEKIENYDNQIFERYKAARITIAEKEREIQAALAKLEDMRADAKTEKQALRQMRANKKAELSNYRDEIEKTQEQVEEYARQAAEAEAEVERLLIKKQQEIDRRNDMGGSDSGGDGTLRWPLNAAGRISSGFGSRTSPTPGASSYHKGIDIAVPKGTPIVAAESGTVVVAAYSSSAGNYIMISHGNRLYTVYMHCSRLAVKEGDNVKRGEVIAYVGSTGISTGNHLHFGVSKNGAYVNPMNYVSR